MPNWCNNNITITGPNSVIDKIEKIVKEEENIDLSSKEKGEQPNLLQYFYPMPKELDETTADGSKNKKMIKKYGYSSWYDWRVDNWSTKWDVNEFHGIKRIELGIDESEISFGFDSAWAPPTGAYEQFLVDNSNCSLKAYYFEGGCDFMGIYDNGDDICYTISEIAPNGSKSNYWTSDEGKELDETFNITEGMAEYEAQQEAERIGDNKEIIDYSKGEKVNV